MKAIVTLKSGKVIEIDNMKQIACSSGHADTDTSDEENHVKTFTVFNNFFFLRSGFETLQLSFQGKSTFLVRGEDVYCVEFLTNG